MIERSQPGVVLHFADVPNRVLGYLLDAVILTGLSVLGAIALSAVLGPVVTIDLAAEPRIDVRRGLALVNAAASTLISAVYFIGSWRWLQGSPGLRLLSMRIGAERDGTPIGFRQGVVRWLFIGFPLGLQGFLTVLAPGSVDALLFLLLSAWFLVLLVSTARSPTKQGIHDRAADSVVVKAARVVPWSDDPAVEHWARVR